MEGGAIVLRSARQATQDRVLASAETTGVCEEWEGALALVRILPRRGALTPRAPRQVLDGYEYAPAFLRRARVRAAFFADAERSAEVREADACPPLWPPFFDGPLFSL